MRALRSLSRPALRRFFLAQAVSLLGSWLQPVAMGWLAWRLTGSATMLGWVTFLSQVPVLALGMLGGQAADRFSRRGLVLGALLLALTQSLALAGLSFSGRIEPWHLLTLAGLLGISHAFEIPARQALLADLSGEDLPNTVAFNSTLVTAMRIIGPSVGGVLVAAVGEGWCFLLNAFSFLGVLAVLWTMSVPPAQARSTTGHGLVHGLTYAFGQPLSRALLLLLIGSSLFGLGYTTLLPVVAEQVLGGGPLLLGRLLACAGVGALLGALSLLFREGLAGLDKRAGLGALCLGSGLLLLSFSRVPMLSYLALVLAGLGQISQTSSTLTLLQGLAPGPLRGRVLGVFTTLFVGVTPLGALAAGAITQRLGAPWTVRTGGVLVMLCATLYLTRRGRRAAPGPPLPPTLFPPQVP